MIIRIVKIIILCFPLYGCGMGAFYCMERDQQKPSTFCDIW